MAALSMSDAELFKLLKDQQSTADQRRRSEIDAQWKQFGEIRDKDLLLRIGFSSEEFVNQLKGAHPARSLADSVENVDRAFDILSASRCAFVDIAGKFHARVVHDLHRHDDREPALNEATKEVYTYSCAVTSLVQAYRHMVSGNDDFKRKYDALRAEIFSGSKIVRFFSDLRNNNNHIHILTASPHYTITTRFEGKREVKSGISFNRDLILNGDWSKESKEFVTERDSLEVVELLDEHYKLASQFKSIVLFRTGIQFDIGYRDLARILHARKTVAARAWLGVVLQSAVPKKLNPYEYLSHWFTESELKNIYSFNDHTREQLEYMIALRDPFGFCDHHTRKELYKLFSVPLDLMPDQQPQKPRVDC